MTMQRISSWQTFFFKRIFPVFWFGILAVITVIVLFAIFSTHKHQPPIFILIWPVVMAIFGWVLMKKMVFDLVDEVWDFGSELFVKNRGEEAHIQLANIVNINYTSYVNPPRITLLLRQPCRFGNEVTFLPKGISFFPFSKNQIAKGLIERVEAVRTG